MFLSILEENCGADIINRAMKCQTKIHTFFLSWWIHQLRTFHFDTTKKIFKYWKWRQESFESWWIAWIDKESPSRHDESQESKKRVFRDMMNRMNRKERVKRVIMNRMNRKQESYESLWIVWLDERVMTSHDDSTWLVHLCPLNASPRYITWES